MQVNPVKFSPPLALRQKGITSGGSRQSFFFQNNLPIKLQVKNLVLKIPYRSGRNNTGRVVINTKKSKSKNFSKPKVNYLFRSTNISFTAGFVLVPPKNKLISLLILSSGAITFVQASSQHHLFILARFKSLKQSYSDFNQGDHELSPFLALGYNFFTIGLLPKNKPVCLLESLPSTGIIYTRSTGSSACILKMNSLTSTALIRLSSGVKKVFSTYSLGSLGLVSLPEQKKCVQNKAGFEKRFGKKSIVRGVAKNPIDHPHGGRAKAIRYQRTPWGKTTKFK